MKYYPMTDEWTESADLLGIEEPDQVEDMRRVEREWRFAHQKILPGTVVLARQISPIHIICDLNQEEAAS